MEAVTLNNGVEMAALGLGVFQTPPDETRDAVRAALGAGYRHIDTAAAYGNERQVGEAVHASGLDRSEVFLETKIWISDYGYAETLHGFEKSAHKLGVDQIDLLILHQALPSAFDRTESRRLGQRSLTGRSNSPPCIAKARADTEARPRRQTAAHPYSPKRRTRDRARDKLGDTAPFTKPELCRRARTSGPESSALGRRAP